jgi:hypothetical protein
MKNHFVFRETQSVPDVYFNLDILWYVSSVNKTIFKEFYYFLLNSLYIRDSNNPIK